MRPIDADTIFENGFDEYVKCVCCGRGGHGCDGACDMNARVYGQRAVEAVESWIEDIPTIDLTASTEEAYIGHEENLRFEDIVRQNICGDGYDAKERADEIINAHYNKYAWHDLRKNPSDLPNPSGFSYFPCLIIRDYSQTPEYAEYEFFEGYGWGFFGIDINSIIAWKEIEPFEE